MEVRREMKMRAIPKDVDPIGARPDPQGLKVHDEPRPSTEPVDDTPSGEFMQPTNAPLAMMSQGSVFQHGGCNKPEKWSAEQASKTHPTEKVSMKMEEVLDRLERLENERRQDREATKYLQEHLQATKAEFGQSIKVVALRADVIAQLEKIVASSGKSLLQVAETFHLALVNADSKWQDEVRQIVGNVAVLEKKVSQLETPHLENNLQNCLVQHAQEELMGKVREWVVHRETQILDALQIKRDNEKRMEALTWEWQKREGLQDSRIQELEKKSACW